MNDQSELPAQILDRCALFFDVDGTLADIKPRPDQVFIPADTLNVLERLARQGVPVALVSGRPLAEIDRLAAPLQLPAAGVHGTERRTAEGRTVRLELDAQRLRQIHQDLAEACARFPGLLLENKQVAFALHFRQAPELESRVRELAEDFVSRHADVLALQPGKCVFELKPRGASKGEVIRAFMQEPPFEGRVPLFIGDDLTDEAAFEVVNALGGISIKVGPGPTVASRRLESVAAVGRWLAELSRELP